ncbi:hypothetical protein [Fusobacterium sp. MFO224]|uniref:hypothetical protein n=1 Tax=Fusobacterium sp. MFO224 TaxID=3378070 RepID=UPI0038549437
MFFYINEKTHEVHKEACDYTGCTNMAFLGVYNNSHEAVSAALSKGYSNADGCAYCCHEMHKK